jgi:hypothetical protein
MNNLSVIIPFRERHQHISVLVPHLRKYAELNNIDMEIIVVEQNDSMPLRRGALRNEGVRVAKHNIIVLHDVDYLPEFEVPYWVENTDVYRPVNRVEFIEMDGSPRNEANVPAGYRKFKECIDDNFFGGVLCITRDKFLQINGYNPLFEGWGLEDDDFRERIRRNNLRVESGYGLFKALPHPDSFKNDELFRRNQILFNNRIQLSDVGVNCGALSIIHNAEKQSLYGVDVWLDVTGWNVPDTTAYIPNTVKLDYGVFCTLDTPTYDYVQNTVASGNRWEPDVMALCEAYVKPDSVVVDVGANMGTFTVRLAQLVGPSGIVIAFEPQRIIYQQLNCNIFLNKLKNVYTHNLALADTQKEVNLTPINYDAGAPGEVRIDGDLGERVLCTSLDSFNLSNVSLIKMDVERYEPFVFDGARRTIETNRPVILFELTSLPLPDYPEDYVISLLSTMNYNIYSISEYEDYIAIPKEKDDNI